MKMEESMLRNMEKLFRTAYYLAIHECPFTDFPKLINLQIINGISLGQTYNNDNAAKEFIGHIAGSMSDELTKLIDNSLFISIFSDGSTDRTVKEKEIIMIKVIENYYSVIKYLKLEGPENTKAEGILNAIDKAFTDFGLNNYHENSWLLLRWCFSYDG